MGNVIWLFVVLLGEVSFKSQRTIIQIYTVVAAFEVNRYEIDMQYTIFQQEFRYIHGEHSRMNFHHRPGPAIIPLNLNFQAYAYQHISVKSIEDKENKKNTNFN